MTKGWNHIFSVSIYNILVHLNMWASVDNSVDKDWLHYWTLGSYRYHHLFTTALWYNTSTVRLSSSFKWHVRRTVQFWPPVALTIKARWSQWIVGTCSCRRTDSRRHVGLRRTHRVWPWKCVRCGSNWWRWRRRTFLQLSNVALDCWQERPITMTANENIQHVSKLR